MNDLRNEIPQRAFLNAQILQCAERTDEFNKCVETIKNLYEIPNYQFMNQAYVASLLYCLIVVPREIWISDRNNEIYKRLSEKKPFDYFKVSVFDGDKSVFDLIRHLRNSISHARFSVDPDMNFSFWDQRTENSPENFHANASSKQLMEFLSMIGSYLANLRSNEHKP